MVHWNYSQVSYDPANPATFSAAVDTALTKHAQLHRRGRHPADAAR